MSTKTRKPDKKDTDASSFQDIPEGDLRKIWKWNEVCPPPIMRCVHEICEEKARGQVDALAISAWDGELHYGELIQLVTKLAKWLFLSGIRPGMIVPLCFEKSLWTTVAMLGVLKAGAAFVMLDTSLPEQRLQAIAESVNANMILSSVASNTIAASLAETVIAIDSTFFSALNNLGGQDPPPVDPSSLMYLAFTSGSTGSPKGLLITHTNYASSLHHQLPLLGFTKETRFYDFSSNGFDASLSHTFTVLAAGGCLCVPSEQDRRNSLAQSITSLRANAIGLTPSVARLLNPADTPTLATLLFFGEALRVSDVQRWWDKVRISNIYGPSECTPYGVINTSAASPQEATRIGKGAGLVTWVVDPDNHDCLLPLGETGELLLEGPLVGEGYLNDAERTARVFIQDPVWLRQGGPYHPGRCGQRLYKTGDLVHYNNDGSLTYVGRKDTQIKIHGQRAELGEIEFCLEQHLPQAKQVIVETITVKQEESSTLLAAFILPRQTSANTEGPGMTSMEIYNVPLDVIQVLAESLPAYMIPSFFLSIREFPRTMSDKLDRKKLRETGTLWFQQCVKDQSHRVKTKPTSHVGIELQRIWGDVLCIDSVSVGLQDNFFRLGGDSIAAMKVVSKARQAGLGLTFSEVFQYPTLGSLEGRCRLEHAKPIESIPPYSLLGKRWNEALLQDIMTYYQLDPNTVEDAYPCTPLQEGLLYLSFQNPGTYMMQRVVELRPDIDTRKLCCAWDKTTQSTPILRTRIIQHTDIGFLQVVLREDIQWIHAKSLQQYLEKDKATPMGFGKPLVRCATVTDEEANRRWFVLTLHHALYDGWSMPLLLQRVRDVYHGMPKGPTQPAFKAFIKYIQGQSHERAVGYWRDNLAECDCEPFPSFPSSVQRVKTDREITHKLSSLNLHTLGFTPALPVRSACALLLSHRTNSDKVVFGVTTSGRSAPITGIEEIVGPTIATIPLYVKIQQSQTVMQYLESIQRQMTTMIPFEQFGLHNIAKTSPGARRACMFQTLLIIQPEETAKADNTFGEWEGWQDPEWDNTYALVLEVQLGTGHVSARFDSNVIKPWIVQDLLEELDFVIQKLATAQSNMRITDLDLVTPHSLERVWGWNRIVPSPVKATINELVEKQVEQHPTGMAIHAWDGDLTYVELDHLATSLATELARLGVSPSLLGPNNVVPLCFEKSKWAIVTILGVLKRGAGFVLLDPSLPESRLRSIIQTVGAKILLSSEANMDLSRHLSKMVIQVGPDLSKVPAHMGNHTKNITGQSPLPSSLLYTVFTSGSIGTPKGVMVSHENFCSALHYQSKLLNYTVRSRVLDGASYSFDAAIHNILTTLVVGGCLCIPSQESYKGDIGSAIAAMRPTICNLTPTVARLLNPERAYDLETLILLGEPVKRSDIDRWRLSNVRVINAYGPAECTPISTINARPSNTEEAIRIGKGTGVTTWIVHPESHNRLVPLGCTGELLLEGPLVGLGYMNDPEKTGDVFVEDSEWLLTGSTSHPGRRGRLYKTGDLVQYNEDGSLSFMGRKDNQVKIRGQRVELGDIEYHVSDSLPTKANQVVAEAVVLEDDGEPKPVLVAFIHSDNNSISSSKETTVTPKLYQMTDEVMQRISRRLYIIPDVFVSMQKLPLTPTGKINRKQLREIGRSLLLSEEHVFFYGTSDPSHSGDDSQGNLILQNDHPAYTIAQKVYSMRPSWMKNGDRNAKTGYRDISLHSSGLDSVNMMELTSFFSRHFNIQVDMQYVMAKTTTIRSLAEYVLHYQKDGTSPCSTEHTSTGVDLMREINRHDTRIRAAQLTLSGSNNPTSKYPSISRDKGSSTVFLTGANGFLGTQILRQLLSHPKISRVICIVRGDTDDAARERTISMAKEALWWTGHHAEKLEVWRGDLTLPKLGLDPARWGSLSCGQTVDYIIHNGATVHWMKGYDVLEAANVGSTMELLQVALRCPRMRFVYITGGRPWKAHEEEDVVAELSAPDAIPYSQTKLVSEVVVRRAATRKLPGSSTPTPAGNICVINPGWVIGTPTEGYSNTTDYIWRLVATCIRLGVYNAEDAEGWLSISDATTTAEAVLDAAFSTSSDIIGDEYATQGMPWREFWAILQEMGYTLEGVSLASWMGLVGADIETAREQHPLWPLKHVYGWLQGNERVAGRTRGQSGDTPVRLKVAVRMGAEFLVRLGFLPAPTGIS
ncbi:non-ribosomal peptide synthetase [Aspergillus luchuensis]|uniref:Non-ribosomal peptide synthetase n=1 Tax=Aspergillus kawachii TaxID=1069201 RepID=A0A146FY41_ASPKA|nr:non-ribosomal peptide synthetase [Aspergillus luchuensis]BCS00623.1 non-ribosomal peptide synthetase [Aspergillus luchuensis]GAA90902.1 non-ribosomal peptide synthetase [Aspergillus luchuensis IFO 4308]GAT29892.1 non-ribosomal peptide synthetase [Aspergillus luchuensis]